MKSSRIVLWIGIAAFVLFAVGVIVGCGEDSGKSKQKSAKPTGPLATKKSLTDCLTAAGLHVDPTANLIGNKLEVQGLAVEYVGTVSFAGGSFGALWVGTGDNQTSPVGRVRDISDINSTGPDLNPNPATLDYGWDHIRNILFAFPADFHLKSGDSGGAKFDQCLRTG